MKTAAWRMGRLGTPMVRPQRSGVPKNCLAGRSTRRHPCSRPGGSTSIDEAQSSILYRRGRRPRIDRDLRRRLTDRVGTPNSSWSDLERSCSWFSPQVRRPSSRATHGRSRTLGMAAVSDLPISASAFIHVQKTPLRHQSIGHGVQRPAKSAEVREFALEATSAGLNRQRTGLELL